MNYTDRVELCEDGLYRWYYDLDMRKDHRMITTPLKVLAVIGLIELVMVQFLPYHSGGMSRWRVMGILAACFALITAITLGICLIQYLARRGYYRYRFEMGPEGVRVLMDEGDMKALQALGAAAEIMSLFAGSGTNIRSTMRASQNAGYTSFRSVRKAALDRAKDCILSSERTSRFARYTVYLRLRFRIPELCVLLVMRPTLITVPVLWGTRSERARIRLPLMARPIRII